MTKKHFIANAATDAGKAPRETKLTPDEKAYIKNSPDSHLSDEGKRLKAKLNSPSASQNPRSEADAVRDGIEASLKARLAEGQARHNERLARKAGAVFVRSLDGYVISEADLMKLIDGTEDAQ